MERYVTFCFVLSREWLFLFQLVVSVDGKASTTALPMGRIAEDGGMKNEESEYEKSKEEESKYAVVVTSVSVPRPSLPDVSKVQYQEIDIKTTHVS